MNYAKPEVVLSGAAVVAVQGNDKTSSPVQFDNNWPHDFTATMHAYEADE